MEIVGVDMEQPNGVIIPVKSVSKVKDTISPMQEYDWIDIENRLIPLVNNVLEKALIR